MKKVVFVIFILCLVFLSACSGSNKQIMVAEAGYSCDAKVMYGENFSSNVTLNVIGGGLFTLSVNTPDNIKGLTFSFDNSEMNINYNGLQSNNIPSEYGGFAEILNEIFLKFTLSKPNILYKDGGYVYEGKNAKYSFEVIFNEQGFPLTITVDEENLTASFSNWKY